MYQLLDFGNGSKLESISGHIVKRPSPAAEFVNVAKPKQWTKFDSSYDPNSKQWTHRSKWPDDLSVDCGGFRMPVRPTPFGHIGLFPEQSDNWQWISNDAKNALGHQDRPLALNLFAYTGASTLALSIAGYEVVHVDAAKPNVAAAKIAAKFNGLSDAPIRYLVDDAAKFVAREIRRRRRYQTIVLDPPAYGHTPKGKTWRLERDLWPLLDDCLKLIDPENFRMLITGHSPQVNAMDVEEYLTRSPGLREISQRGQLKISSGRSGLHDLSGRKLDTGFFVRIETV
ncbi:23S rRNA m(2)G2445 methyltransferase [Planctomycetes bacterium CA13]|uniref:23S rRNA m(2)G2445 methyltransferase n=1 Tax=Novipirellula herctigrandis TaxID=2527986 RepID=A0A5C5Z1Q9_9BACT|nr:23S rRNA m(2)G2445 methyltransferase [Planctomycetes bacterium CA13]